MDDRPPRRGDAQQSEGDLEYDLAHEGEAAARAARECAPQWSGRIVRVPTASTDHHGDYGYDLAHEVP